MIFFCQKNATNWPKKALLGLCLFSFSSQNIVKHFSSQNIVKFFFLKIFFSEYFCHPRIFFLSKYATNRPKTAFLALSFWANSQQQFFQGIFWILLQWRVFKAIFRRKIFAFFLKKGNSKSDVHVLKRYFFESKKVFFSIFCSKKKA